jgi:RND family efflux transporter MFP subunit
VGEDGFPHQGRVDFFDNEVNARTGTIRMRGVFANADRALVPGMFARVRVPAGPPESALLVPAVAIGSDQGNKQVMVVNQDSVVETRLVQVGRQHGALRAVTEGITTQDRVVINGLLMARPGARVEVVDAPAPKAQK